MDDNKLNKLREIGYTIRKSCGECEHGGFNGNNYWGTCQLHRYSHKKHDGGVKGADRELSIYCHGVCEDFVKSSCYELATEHYKEFYE